MIEGTVFIAHPNNVKLLKEYLTRKLQSPPEDVFYSNILGIRIEENAYLDEFQDTGEWERTKVLEDTSFVQWIDDLKNPPSRAIYFGLVKRQQKRVYYTLGKIWTFN